jgi:hypothetical protein
MKLFWCLFLTILSNNLRAQSTDSSKLRCIDTLKHMSYWWKLDSLANNGYRYETRHRILDCDFKGITKSVLLEVLGSPNEIKKTNKGVDYRYYYFNIKKMPIDYDGSSMILFINFELNENEELILSISDQHSDVFR